MIPPQTIMSGLEATETLRGCLDSEVLNRGGDSGARLNEPDATSLATRSDLT